MYPAFSSLPGVPPIPPKPSTRGIPPTLPPKGIKVSQSASGLATYVGAVSHLPNNNNKIHTYQYVYVGP